MFRARTLHTFTAPGEPLLLLSSVRHYFPLDLDAQYTVPERGYTPMGNPPPMSRVSIDAAWSMFARWDHLG